MSQVVFFCGTGKKSQPVDVQLFKPSKTMRTKRTTQINYKTIKCVNCFLSAIYGNLEQLLKPRHLLEHILEHIFVIPKHLFPMNTITRFLPVAMVFLLATGCQETPQPAEPPSPLGDEPVSLSRFDYDRYNNGKIKHASRREDLFTEASLDSLELPEFNDKLVKAIEAQLDVLRMRKSQKHQRIGDLDVSVSQLERTVRILLDGIQSGRTDFRNELKAYQSWGKDQKGHVRFTGYFTPEIKVKKTPDDKYKYPIYRRPKDWDGPLPTRAEIDGKGALKGLGLELAYAKSLVDIYYMQLQGSGYARFVDTGERVLFRFDGGNGKKYRSIERYILKNPDLNVRDISLDGIKRFLSKNPELTEEVLFKNPSYCFFRPTRGAVKGAGGVPLTPDVSVAADPDYFPLGSVVLADVPIYDKKGRIIDHEFKILLPQDTGAAIDGPGHVDIYCGIGEKGKRKASGYHHYGNMWILLPNELSQLAMK
ncbi:MAG: hypothetical protein D6714_16255 [Bacteroidetes bacterium]|nr:MAG: hypothetical protein D6714_16255 [Bacteroidota bacterium]